MADMKFTKYWTSDRTRKKQAALTRLSNSLRNEVLNNPQVSELFDPSELEAMAVAASALSRVKHTFTKLKEDKERVEKRKAKELANMKAISQTHAKKVFDSLNPQPDTFTKEQLLMWLTAAKFTRRAVEPEFWEYNIEDRIDDHYLESDDALRQKHIWSMRDKTLETFQQFLEQAWVFDFGTDSWVAKEPIQDVVAKLLSLKEHEQYQLLAKRCSSVIEPLESYNRRVEALKRRKAIKSVK